MNPSVGGVVLQEQLKRIEQIQFMLMLFGSALLFVFLGLNEASSFLFGSVLVLLAGRHMSATLRKATAYEHKRAQALIYRGATIRFLSLLAFLFLAVKLELHLLIVGAALLVLQSVLYFVGLRSAMNQLRE